MQDLVASVTRKKAELDRLRARAPGGLRNFEHVQDLELTYTSNAIEGNTLTAPEVTLVIEQGIAVAGKPLRDHLEAVDHFEAIRYVRQLARQAIPFTEGDLRNLHRLVMLRSAPEVAGRYADQGRIVLTDTGRHAFPSPAEVPALMGDFATWLGHTTPTPVAVRPRDRAAYIAALQQAQAGKGAEAFDGQLYERLDATLDEYLSAAGEALPAHTPPADGGTPA